MNARLRMRLLKPARPVSRTPIGAAALENADRAAYQSARCINGYLAPMPLTLAEAWEEAHGEDYMRSQTLDGAPDAWSRA